MIVSNIDTTIWIQKLTPKIPLTPFFQSGLQTNSFHPRSKNMQQRGNIAPGILSSCFLILAKKLGLLSTLGVG